MFQNEANFRTVAREVDYCLAVAAVQDGGIEVRGDGLELLAQAQLVS